MRVSPWGYAHIGARAERSAPARRPLRPAPQGLRWRWPRTPDATRFLKLVRGATLSTCTPAMSALSALSGCPGPLRTDPACPRIEGGGKPARHPRSPKRAAGPLHAPPPHRLLGGLLLSPLLRGAVGGQVAAAVGQVRRIRFLGIRYFGVGKFGNVWMRRRGNKCQ